MTRNLGVFKRLFNFLLFISKIIMLQIDTDCEKCGDTYTSVEDRWCKPCQINDLKKKFINWTNGNEIVVDYLIQFMQQDKHKPVKPDDIIFEWIPYNQLDNI